MQSSALPARRRQDVGDGVEPTLAGSPDARSPDRGRRQQRQLVRRRRPRRRRRDVVAARPLGHPPTLTRRLPDAVTLSPGTEPAAVLARVEGGTGCSVKDSFADLDLAPSGFQVLFDATWIRPR